MYFLGRGVVIDIVSKDIYWDSPIVLISPYKSIANVAADYSYYFGYCKSLFESMDRFKSYEKISEITCPIKIFHGINDATIPINHSVSLYKLLSNKKYKPTWITDAGHKDILSKVDYNEVLEDILPKVDYGEILND